MIIPHEAGNPIHLSLPLSLILGLLAIWAGTTFWASYLSAQHVDYWRSKATNQILELKLRFLSYQLDKSRSFIDEVRQMEAKLRGSP